MQKKINCSFFFRFVTINQMAQTSLHFQIPSCIGIQFHLLAGKNGIFEEFYWNIQIEKWEKNSEIFKDSSFFSKNYRYWTSNECNLSWKSSQRDKKKTHLIENICIDRTHFILFSIHFVLQIFHQSPIVTILN